MVGFGSNLHQEWLWECWRDAIERVKEIVGKSGAVLLVNGDSTEGCHHHNSADLIASAIETHTAMAEECLRPLTKLCRKVLVTRGTECHTQNMESRLAERIGAETGKARDEWLFEMGGCLIEAKHHMGVTSRSYLEASLMSIHMGNARLNRLRSKHRVPDVFLRGHRHCGGYFCDGAGVFGVSGGWQMLTRHGQKVVPDSLPSPTVLILDWRGKPNGSLPQVYEIKFRLPQPTIRSF